MDRMRHGNWPIPLVIWLIPWVPTNLGAEPLTVRVAICQMQSDDFDVSGNLGKVERYVEQAAAAGAEICVFPELVDVGFGKASSPTGGEHARPVPGETSDMVGAIAAHHGVWIATALLEAVPGGTYDTSVVIDNRGKLVLKQRKAFVYPSFGGVPTFQGNYQDARVVGSPWGPIGVMNCADIGSSAKRGVFPVQQPALMLVSFANPQANLLDHCATLARECGCPVAGVNMVFPDGAGKNGGKSRFCTAGGSVLWQAPAGVERMKTYDLTVDPPPNLRPCVHAGEVMTIRLPVSTMTLHGYVTDDGRPDGTLTILWSMVAGPGTVSFDDASVPSTQVILSNPGVYLFRLRADDGALSAIDEVTVNLLPEGDDDPYLAGYWPFDGGADDASGKGNHGTLAGNPSYSADVAPAGLPGSRSLDLDGDGDYVRINHDPSLDAPDAVTIALWVRPRSYPGFWPTGNDWAALVNKGDTWGEQNYLLGFGAYFYLHADGMGMRIPSLGDAMRTPDRWHHVAITLDGKKKQGRIYVNGVLDHTVHNIPTPYTNSDPLYIGTNRPTTTKIDGRIDDVRLYKRVLADEEIAALVPGAIVNRPPTVDAGDDIMLSSASTATLQGSYADDVHPATSVTAAWTRWRKVSGPGDVLFEDRYTPATTAGLSEPGSYVLELMGSDGAHRVSDTIRITVTAAREFIRGDADGDGRLTISDVIRALLYIFAVPPLELGCVKAIDVDDDGIIGLPDAIRLLLHTFAIAPGDPPEPFPDCGPDPVADKLPCDETPSSCLE